eukprot:2989642-Rhodomonas_salina.2
MAAGIKRGRVQRLRRACCGARAGRVFRRRADVPHVPQVRGGQGEDLRGGRRVVVELRWLCRPAAPGLRSGRADVPEPR